MRPPLVVLLSAALALSAGAARAQQAGPASPPPYGPGTLAFRGVGLEVGVVYPARADPALLLGGRFEMGYLTPRLRVVPRITFWSSELQGAEVRAFERRVEELCDAQSECPPIDFGEVRLSDLALGVDAHYILSESRALRTYAGAGVGIHLLNGQGDLIDGTFVEDLLDAFTPGADVMAGAEVLFGPSFRVTAEARGVLASNARYVGVSVGGALTLAGGRRTPSLGEAGEGR